MASLTILSRAFAGVVDAARADLYTAALDDVSDEQLEAATVRLVRTHSGEFIPNPATIRNACGANHVPAQDVDAVLKGIERLGSYNPNTGWNAPRVSLVREEMGDAVAEAYGAAGGSRVFADNETTREIAARDFGKALVLAESEVGRTALPLEHKRLPGKRRADGPERIGDILGEAL